MRLIHYFLCASLVLVPVVAVAQEKSDAAPLPAICTKGGAAGMTSGAPTNAPDGPAGGMAMPMDEAHKELAAGMAKMRADMTAGMQVTDIDIAFNCGMIPHHQGAIFTARIELKYGKDPENRKLAREIIAEQEQQISGMSAWLQKHSK
jgi:uncharacterized protein (DUF305 family)